MQMPDVDVLVYAHRQEAPQHARYSRWLNDLVNGEEPFALSVAVMQGFVRLTTHPKVFRPAATVEEAFAFLAVLLGRPGCNVLRPGAGHWRIFRELCLRDGIRGNLVMDAAHAALAIEYGCEWVTADSDYARFAPPLRWRLL